MYDDPENQHQDMLVIDPAVSGNIAVCGAIVSGKSTFLQTFIYEMINKYTPDDINIYILDFSTKMLAAFEGEAHIGGVAYDSDLDKIDKFFAMMGKEIARRKEMLRGGNYSQYLRSNKSKDLPAIMIVIDNIANFRGKTDGAYDDTVLQLLKEGVGYGIFFAISAAGFGSAELPNKFADNLKTIIALEMNDKFAYSEVMRSIHLDVLPEVNVKGRGLAYVGDRILEFQTALSIKAEDDYQRGEKIRDVCGQMNAAWNGERARPIPEIPDKPLYDDYISLKEAREMSVNGDLLPFGYDAKYAGVYGVDLSRTYTYLLSGKERSGKTNAMKVLIKSAALKGGRIIVIDTENDFESVADEVGAERITDAQGMHDFISSFIPEIQKRNKRKHELIHQGLTEEEIYLEMKEFERIYIFIGDIVGFVQAVYNPGKDIEEFAPVTDNIVEKGALHNMYWFACINQDKLSTASGQPLFKHLTADRRGVHFGGNLSSQRILAFDYVPYMEQGKSMKSGIAMISQENDDRDTQKIIVPLVKG